MRAAIRLPRPLRTLAFSLMVAVGVAACGSSAPVAVDASTHAGSWPGAALPASDAATVDAQQFIAASQLRDWGVDLDRRGLRATGSPAHEAYIDELYRRLRAAGVRYWEEDHGAQQSVYFEDPDGVVLEITAPPSHPALSASERAARAVRRWMHPGAQA